MRKILLPTIVYPKITQVQLFRSSLIPATQKSMLKNSNIVEFISEDDYLTKMSELHASNWNDIPTHSLKL